MTPHGSRRGAGLPPKDLVAAPGAALDRADADALAAFCADEAVNHPVAGAPVVGRAAIGATFRDGFVRADTVCIPATLFQDGERARPESRDPRGLRGCGLLRIVDGVIEFRRGCRDKPTLLRRHGLPVPAP